MPVDQSIDGVGSSFHDPQREIEKLREHLASNNKPIAFLFGAGASCAIRVDGGRALIPAVAELGDQCRLAVTALGENCEQAYACVVAEIESTRADALAANIEEVLSAVRRKIDAMGDGDQLCGATRDELCEIEQTIRMAIAKAVQPAEDLIPTSLPHHSLARWIARISRTCPVELFTTNYDTLLERALEDERVPIFDGFVGSREPFFLNASLTHEEFAPGQRWTRLWKVHGSVNWKFRSDGDTRRIVRAMESDDGELILPSFHKYDESRKQPYVAMLDRLGRVLTVREDVMLIVVGYNFGDQHINAVIFEALETHERMHVVALQFSDPDEGGDLVRRAKRHRNLLVYGPSSAVVGGEFGKWRLTEPVDRRTAQLMDVPFDSDAVFDDEKALQGKFRLGDFVWFARFLDGMAGTSV
jgi:hypothetical protein